jgi:hypothetical protein
MVRLFWVDEHASARRPDHVPGRGADVRFRSGGIATRPYARSAGRSSAWRATVEWCGHGQELIPVPDEGERVRLVAMIGTAK